MSAPSCAIYVSVSGTRGRRIAGTERKPQRIGEAVRVSYLAGATSVHGASAVRISGAA